MMKTFNLALLSLLVVCGLAAAGSADARGRHHHHHGHGHRADVGIWFGGPIFPYYRPYYYPRYYYPPTVVLPAPSAPPVYIEQSTVAPPLAGDAQPAAPSTQSAGAYWYYCPESRTYYPYVQHCATPWQPVVPHTPPPS